MHGNINDKRCILMEKKSFDILNLTDPEYFADRRMPAHSDHLFCRHDGTDDGAVIV